MKASLASKVPKGDVPKADGSKVSGAFLERVDLRGDEGLGFGFGRGGEEGVGIGLGVEGGIVSGADGIVTGADGRGTLDQRRRKKYQCRR